MTEITGDPGDAARTPSAQLRALGLAGRTVPVEDAPRWHLSAAAEEIAAGRWDTARAALDRARGSAPSGTPEAAEVAILALHLAVASLDVRSAREAVDVLVSRMDPDDPVLRSRVERILDEAPPAFPEGLRAALRVSLSPAATEEGGSGRVADRPGDPLPSTGLPLLPGDESWTVAWDGGRPEERGPERSLAVGHAMGSDGSMDGEEAGSPAMATGRSDADYVPEAPEARTPGAGSGGEAADLTGAGTVRDRLVEALEAYASDETADVLLSLAAVFLQHQDHGAAESVAAVAMQVPSIRLAACELYLEAMVNGGRIDAALACARMAERLFAREGDALLGIVYWHGVAAQMRDDHVAARACFTRIRGSQHGERFADLTRRMATLPA